MTEMANQIKVGGVDCSQKQSANSSAKHQVNFERERGKMEVANHLILVNCFTIDQELYPMMQTTQLFLKYGHFERAREREREMKVACVNYLHLCVNSELENLRVYFI